MATYAQTATLINSSSFSDSVKIAVAQYAQYILGEGQTAANHNLRAQWAKPAFTNPAGVAAGLLTVIALDPNVQAALPGTPTDAVISAATQTAINTMMNF